MRRSISLVEDDTDGLKPLGPWMATLFVTENSRRWWAGCCTMRSVGVCWQEGCWRKPCSCRTPGKATQSPQWSSSALKLAYVFITQAFIALLINFDLQIISCVVQVAKGSGHRQLYLWTSDPVSVQWYTDLGWNAHDSLNYRGKEATIMTFLLWDTKHKLWSIIKMITTTLLAAI